MTSFLWFALTFWIYLETESVLATSVIGGAFAIFSAAFGVLFGTFVDRHRKWTSMFVASVLTLVAYTIALVLYAVTSHDSLVSFGSPSFWLLIALVLFGSVVGNLRSIAMSTAVTLLVPEDRRDRANGLVGTVLGVSFTITSVLSGLAVGQLGMGWALIFSVALTLVAVIHLLTIRFPEPAIERADDAPHEPMFDFRGALDAISSVSGLYGLIFFAAFNNLLGGVFMSLLDAYGLSLMSVEAWGMMFAVLSLGFIAGGLVVAKRGLGARPMRVILICNAVNWTLCSVFTLQSSIPLLFVGMLVWMSLMPAIEAAEQTVLQQVVPYEKQGRVFGFAQTVESAASPFTALLIGPMAQFAGDPVHDRRSRRRPDRRVVRHRPGAWTGVDLHHRRDHRGDRDDRRRPFRVVPPVVGPHRFAGARRAVRPGRATQLVGPVASRSSDRGGVAESGDVVPGETRLQQHLLGVLAEFGGGLAGACRRVAEPHGRGHHRIAVGGAGEIAVRPDVRVGDDGGVVAHRSVADAVLGEQLAPLGGGPRRRGSRRGRRTPPVWCRRSRAARGTVRRDRRARSVRRSGSDPARRRRRSRSSRRRSGTRRTRRRSAGVHDSIGPAPSR